MPLNATILPVPEIAPEAIYSREEVRRLLALSERQLRGWEKNRLIPAMDQFAFSDLIALRTLVKLRESHISPAQIRRVLAALRERLQGITDPLKQLRLISDGRRIHVQVGANAMEPISGQLLLNFDAAELKRLVSFPDRKKTDESRSRRESAEKWFQRGLESEQTGAVQDAIKAYESAVALDPSSAGAWLNLGTIFFNARQFSKAESHYRKALEADPKYALAHFNIANLYDERGDYDRALRHYQESVRLHPGYADAHYNLALLCQGSGKVMDAVRHWKTYLKLDPGSSWASIARRELDKLRRHTVLTGKCDAGIERD